MTNFNISNVTLTFEFAGLNDEFMSLQVINGDEVKNVTPENNTVGLTVEFPTAIKLAVSGKNMDRDTKMDDAGNIIADKHIKLTGLVIDRFTVDPEIVKTLPVIGTADSEFRSSYFGFNGEVILPFEGKSALHWIIKNN